MNTNDDLIFDMAQRIEMMEIALDMLIRQRNVQSWYSTKQIAQLLEKSEFTVREWCRLGRVHAEKRPSGRGKSQEWMISHDEFERIKSEGLLPLAKH